MRLLQGVHCTESISCPDWESSGLSRYPSLPSLPVSGRLSDSRTSSQTLITIINPVIARSNRGRFPIQVSPRKLPSTGATQNTPWLLCACFWDLYTKRTYVQVNTNLTPTSTQQLHCQLSKPFSFVISLIGWMLLRTLSTVLQFGCVLLPISNPNAYPPIVSRQRKRSMPQMILTILL